jgi:chorismate dehydratase
MNSRRIRVGAVNYLNTKPLIEGLTSFAPNIDLRLAPPSKLAEQLHDGDLDVALIPVIEFFRGVGYSIVPGIAIASRGPVLSVTLFSRVPWEQIRSVALDAGSRTSAALAEILLKRRYHVEAVTQSLPLDAGPEGLSTDAVLLIGDRAMRACLPGFAFAYDLGQEWFDWTGLPFVYAVWAVREGVELNGVDRALTQAKKYGAARAGLIAQREAPLLELDAGFCRRYLSNILTFDLGSRERAGLDRFYSLACELGLAPTGVNLAFYEDEELQIANCKLQIAN